MLIFKTFTVNFRINLYIFVLLLFYMETEKKCLCSNFDYSNENKKNVFGFINMFREKMINICLVKKNEQKKYVNKDA